MQKVRCRRLTIQSSLCLCIILRCWVAIIFRGIFRQIIGKLEDFDIVYYERRNPVFIEIIPRTYLGFPVCPIIQIQPQNGGAIRRRYVLIFIGEYTVIPNRIGVFAP